MPTSRTESWTVLGDDDAPIEPVERFLAYLTDIERSPNTVKAYAHDLKGLLGVPRPPGSGVAGGAAGGLEDIGEFVARLRMPASGRAGAVAVLPSVEPHVGAATINRKLSAVAAFYQHTRCGRAQTLGSC